VQAETQDEILRLAKAGKLTVWCRRCDHRELPLDDQAKIVKELSGTSFSKSSTTGNRESSEFGSSNTGGKR